VSDAVTVVTHRRPLEVAEALAILRRQATEAGVTLRFDAEESEKHGLTAGPGIEVGVDSTGDERLCLVLGGDGTILTALRRYVGTTVPVFAVNFGEVGFLATVDADATEEGIARALGGEFDTLALPALLTQTPEGARSAINDISVHRHAGKRVADLSYAIGPDEIGRVRCDGLVVSTPAGSTGYNLANGGPVMAWGVEGFVVSFIAPHSLTARTLVVAPGDTLTVHNRSRDEPAEVSVDGRPAYELAAGEAMEVAFADDRAVLAQMPDASFYHRLREKFGRLAS